MSGKNTARVVGTSVVVVVLLAVLVSWTRSGNRSWSSAASAIGAGTIQSFVEVDAKGFPASVGVRLTADALKQLPEKMNDHSRCHDVDKNGHHGRGECIGDYETIMEIPADVAQRANIPFKWVLVNWNPEGHMPPAPPVYTEPHFDFHFYTIDRASVEAIAPGSCGELVDCDDFKRGSAEVAPDYMPPGHLNVGAVVPRMGNHLIDSQSPELANPPAKFTRTFIYGSFDGALIFWEPMITRAFLTSVKTECFPLRLPKKFMTPGNYPTEYCVRFDETSRTYSVSLEKFRAF